MINNCTNKNPLLRDGTSQQQRLLKALLPGYVSVDERSMDDLIKFAREYAKEIQYYGPGDTPNGDWYDFFVKEVQSDQRTEPHYALFIAFLEMFRFAQDDLNSITARHLEFYYRDVLRIKEKDAVPDQVYIIFELAKDVTSHLIKKGTVLNAGKDKTGQDLFYKTDKDIVVNRTSVKELKALFLDVKSTSPALNDRLYSSSIANSSDGKGGELDATDPRWRTFGRPNQLGTASERQLADIGFAISSPVLAMAEGKRTVTITLTFAEPITSINPVMLATAFKVFLSGEKGWIETGFSTRRTMLHSTELTGNTITIVRTLDEGKPAVTSYNEEVLKDNIQAKWPVAKIVLNNNVRNYIYKALRKLTLVSADVSVYVEGVSSLLLQNDFSDLDPSKPFEPFTTRPVIGSTFYIGSNEIFRKHLSELDINIEWHDLPSDFSAHYHNYYDFPVNNRSFKASISILNAKRWTPLVTEQLFDTALDSSRNITIKNPIQTIPADPSMDEITELDTHTKKGFIRLVLEGSDFGHKQYPLSYTKRIIAAGGGTPSLPNEPYTPTIKSISLNYRSSAKIDFSRQDPAGFSSRIDQYFHLYPFGVAEAYRFTALETIPLLPVFTDEGTLYIGLEGLHPSQTLSLLFKVAEGSADPDLDKQTVHWHYMVNNRWEEFNSLNILADSTNGLLTTGIITFDIPKAASSNNTVLTNGLHWLRATVKERSGAVCDLLSVIAQAVTATFNDQGNDREHLKESLPSGTIKELELSESEVEKVTQPYASFGGKMKEQGSDFYLRVSERLRHKHRAITIWDYEHLVLERFPSVYKVKCLNRTVNSYDKIKDRLVYSEIAPGHVTLVIISNLRNKNAVNPLKPHTSLITLEEIRQYITAINPPCSQLHVVNPFFEEIKVHFNVRFHQGYDKGYYGKKLEEEIKQFLAPWAYNAVDVVIGGKIHSSVIINFIEEREYVDYITCFKMDQFTMSGTMLPDIEVAIPSTASSILTSSDSHEIHVLESEDCECSDNEVGHLVPGDVDIECEKEFDPNDPKGDGSGSSSGIGKVKVGSTFIIGASPAPGIDYMQIGNDFDIQ